MADTRDKLFWFLIGAAAGAGVALLYAPQSGEETRRYLATKAEKGREVVAESGREIFEKGKDLLEKGRKIAEDASELIERGRKAVKA